MRQSGFTLLELMIVVAVLGILSSIAIPRYNDYLKRSQAMGGLTTIAALKTNVETYIIVNGYFPVSSDGDEVFKELGALSSHQLGTLSLTRNGGNQEYGEIKFSFADSTNLDNESITLIRNATGWKCNTSIKDKIKPHQCETAS